METLAAIIVIILLFVIAVCLLVIEQRIRNISDKHTDERREYYRHKAYKAKAEARAIKEARKKVWDIYKEVK